MNPVPTLERLLGLVDSRPATLGAGRLVCVDGPSGSGKTTVAQEIAAARPAARVVHLDDLYPGWDGLPHVEAQLTSLLTPLARGETGRYRRWDWHTDSWAEEVTVPPGPLLVLEGVGSGSPVARAHATVLVWVEAAYDLRRLRGLERDGAAFEPHWEAWAAAEAEHFARHPTREVADLIVDGGAAGSA